MTKEVPRLQEEGQIGTQGLEYLEQEVLQNGLGFDEYHSIRSGVG